MVQGGSTITQQVAKNLWLGPERSLGRKLEEMVLTWRLEQVVQKARILEVYLNLVELGSGIYGIGAAAQHYFRVPAEELTRDQAAQLAAAEPGTAAIAGEAAAARYQLPKLAQNIEDEPNNTTRFLVLGKHDAGVSGRDKTSLIMSAPNRTGALHDLLLPLAEANVSMSRLESRPARNALWEYVFYVDIEGHRDEPNVKAAMEKLAASAAYLKILGSYPVAVY